STSSGSPRRTRCKSLDAVTTWGVGSYPEMALRLEPVATRAVQLGRPGAGDRVLDVACGTGNGGLTAAALGATVVGVDVEPVLLEVARERTGPDVRPRVQWLIGDAEALPAADAAFD